MGQSEGWKIFWYVLGWVVTTLISLITVVVAYRTLQTGLPASKLSQDQIQQLINLQKATPTGQITAMTPYPPSRHAQAISNIRQDPFVFQQVYSLSIRANHIPDNGQLFIMVHVYGQTTGPYSTFYPTQVNLVFGKQPINQNWKAPRVYLGTPSAPKSTETYRVSLYFCNSLDSVKLSKAANSPHKRNYGLRYLNYPSCRQLDSIFVRRASHGQR